MGEHLQHVYACTSANKQLNILETTHQSANQCTYCGLARSPNMFSRPADAEHLPMLLGPPQPDPCFFGPRSSPDDLQYTLFLQMFQ